MQQESITTLCHVGVRGFLLKESGNSERHEVSKLEDRVQCQICFKNTKDQPKHVVLVVVCYKALPSRSRNKQSNEAVDSSCTLLAFTV